MRRRERDEARRLRAGEDVPPALGRLGVTVRAHYGALPISAAGRVRVKAGESQPDDSRWGVPSTRKHGPLAKNRRGGAP